MSFLCPHKESSQSFDVMVSFGIRLWKGGDNGGRRWLVKGAVFLRARSRSAEKMDAQDASL